jgi:hypothetical protein
MKQLEDNNHETVDKSLVLHGAELLLNAMNLSQHMTGPDMAKHHDLHKPSTTDREGKKPNIEIANIGVVQRTSKTGSIG